MSPGFPFVVVLAVVERIGGGRPSVRWGCGVGHPQGRGAAGHRHSRPARTPVKTLSHWPKHHPDMHGIALWDELSDMESTLILRTTPVEDVWGA